MTSTAGNRQSGGLKLAATLCALAVAPALLAADASTAGGGSAARAVEPATGAVDAASPAICGDGPLEILLTNDDGYQAPGIRALYDALRQAGHHVRLAAPVTNASGSSLSFTWSTVSVVTDPADPNVIGISATPATAVVLAATALYPPGRGPDLVVSGINDGANTGSLLALSGTVGAALAGTVLLDPPVPGIAVSAGRTGTPSAPHARSPEELARVATHLARLVSGTRAWFCEGGKLLRSTTVLNVNYPARPMAEVRGIGVARQGRSTDLRLRFEPSGPAVYESRQLPAAPASDAADSDVMLLGEGYVTVTPISAHLGEHDVPVEDLERRLAATKLQ
jgi:5'/3'-nucleotidase SurE